MGAAKFYKEEDIMNSPGLREQPTSKSGGGCSALETPPAVKLGCPTGPHSAPAGEASQRCCGVTCGTNREPGDCKGTDLLASSSHTFFSALFLIKDVTFCELRGDHMKVFFHCTEGDTASPASTLTMALSLTQS